VRIAKGEDQRGEQHQIGHEPSERGERRRQKKSSADQAARQTRPREGWDMELGDALNVATKRLRGHHLTRS
jgi:hypothetical protein